MKPMSKRDGRKVTTRETKIVVLRGELRDTNSIYWKLDQERQGLIWKIDKLLVEIKSIKAPYYEHQWEIPDRNDTWGSQGPDMKPRVAHAA